MHNFDNLTQIWGNSQILKLSSSLEKTTLNFGGGPFQPQNPDK